MGQWIDKPGFSKECNLSPDVLLEIMSLGWGAMGYAREFYHVWDEVTRYRIIDDPSEAEGEYK